ncbi:MAG: hypothetical protein R3E66_03325 [bacterium]
MRFVLLSFVFLVACGDAPVKKGGSNVVNNTSTNNTNNTNGGTNNVTNGTNNVNTNNTCGCAANEECVFETDEPTCQCRPGYEQTDRGCILRNEPPVVSNVSISPMQPLYPGQPLRCEYTFSIPTTTPTTRRSNGSSTIR